MITKRISRLMSKHKCTEAQAKKMLKTKTINDLMAKHSCTEEEALKLWNIKRGNSGLRYEQKLSSMLISWNLKARRFPRSGQVQKEGTRVSDIKMTLESKDILIESKQRSTPGTLYDRMQVNPLPCYIKDFCYVLPQDDFRRLVVDRIPPTSMEIFEDKRFKKYHDYFEETPYKREVIDILSLVQKQHSYVFFIRPNTYEFLLKRCKGESA